MSSIQRSLNTLQYCTGTQNGVLITEVSAIQRFVIERFHCICVRTYISMYMYVHIDAYTRTYIYVYSCEYEMLLVSEELLCEWKTPL